MCRGDSIRNVKVQVHWSIILLGHKLKLLTNCNRVSTRHTQGLYIRFRLRWTPEELKPFLTFTELTYFRRPKTTHLCLRVTCPHSFDTHLSVGGLDTDLGTAQGGVLGDRVEMELRCHPWDVRDKNYEVDRGKVRHGPPLPSPSDDLFTNSFSWQEQKKNKED